LSRRGIHIRAAPDTTFHSEDTLYHDLKNIVLRRCFLQKM
jgi:hypothetical protein